MKATGVIRPVDGLGRVVLPIELRKQLGINAKDCVEIFVSDDSIVLKKHEQSCVFCKSTEDVNEFRGKCVCKACIKDILNVE